MPKHKTKYLKHSSIITIAEDDPAGKWISQSEAARIRGVSPQAISDLVKKGRFRILSIGGKTLLDRREVEKYKTKRKGRPRK
jgi:excisionase family DNA binding protein